MVLIYMLYDVYKYEKLTNINMLKIAPYILLPIVNFI